MKIIFKDSEGRIHFSANAHDLCVHLSAMDRFGPIQPCSISTLTVEVYENEKLVASEKASPDPNT